MVSIYTKQLSALWIVLLSLSLEGCCQWATPSTMQNPDRFECLNRSVYAFNKAADRVLMQPAARAYEALIPRPLQRAVSNFFQNLGDLPSAGNDLLQGNVSGMCSDLGRFLINSTWGLGGLIDWAGMKGVPARKQDFGLTLAKWGYTQSSYLVLPFLGPSTVRDGIGRVVTYEMSIPARLRSVRARNQLFGLYYLSTRAYLLKIDSALRDSVDEYIFVREAYLQHRQSEIAGKPSTGSMPSELDGPPD